MKDSDRQGAWRTPFDPAEHTDCVAVYTNPPKWVHNPLDPYEKTHAHPEDTQ